MLLGGGGGACDPGAVADPETEQDPGQKTKRKKINYKNSSKSTFFLVQLQRSSDNFKFTV